MEAHVTLDPSQETMADSTFHDFSALTIDGERREMGDYRGRLVLVVNTATQCAFTPQLTALQELHDSYAEHGFTVLGFPSDQFRQDPGTDAETKETCTSTYDVRFPLFSKIDVNGPTAHPLWKWMCTQKAGVIGGRIAWNFTKFLIDGEGKVLRRYAPPVPPVRIARRIESELVLRP
jgi:glutathione peroxidase